MCDILLISRRSSHKRYYERLKSNSSLDINVHVMGLPRLSALKYLSSAMSQNLDGICLAQLERKQSIGSVLTKNQFISKLYFRMLVFVQKLRLAKFLSLFDNDHIQLIGIWNGGKLPNSIICKAAALSQKKIVFFENGLLPNTTTIDYKGVNANNSVPREAEFYQQFSSLPPSLSQFKQRKSSKKIAASNRDLPTSYIFVPLQVANDTQVINNSPWVRSMPQLFNLLLEMVNMPSLKGTKFVIKEHPSCKLSYHDYHNLNARIIFINDLSSEQLIEKAAAVITINSTVGMEAIIKEKPVLTLGNSCYNIEGLVLHAHNLLEAIAKLERLKTWKMNIELRNQFLNFLSEVYTIPTDWDKADEKHFKAFDERILKLDKFSQIVRASGSKV